MANPHTDAQQRLDRLTPLGDILTLIAAGVSAVAPQKLAGSPCTFTLAEDVVAPDCPARAIAIRDGFPVDAAEIADAGPYAPVPLPLTTRRIDVGEPLPGNTNAVLPLDAVTAHGQRLEAIAGVAAGDGVLPAGGDATPQLALRRAGERVRAIDVALMGVAGAEGVMVRAPRIHIVYGSDARGPHIERAVATLIRVTEEAGAVVSGGSVNFDEVAAADEQTAAIMAVGGTGSGQRDAAVQKLAQFGRVAAHGIAVSPGETAAFGFIGARPVLLVPGRFDAALALWLLIGRHLVAKLAGGSVDDAPVSMPLKRKVASTIGLTELVPVACGGGMAEPLARGYLSLTALARSDGWIAVPADSEGYRAGAIVGVKSWP